MGPERSEVQKEIGRHYQRHLNSNTSDDKRIKKTSLNTLNCIFLNADCLTNKMAELEFIIKTETPDIIGINEVLPKNHTRKIHSEEFRLDGYEMITHPNVNNNNGRGSLLYVKKNLNYKQVTITANGNEFQEGLYAEIKLNTNETILCACMYRRGESDDENNELLFQTLKDISNMGHNHILIMGDFNMKGIDWINWTSPGQNICDLNHRFIECIRDCYFFQHVTEPKRQRGTDTPSTLDLIFTNEEHMIDDVCIEAPLGNSDHAILKFEFKCRMEEKPPVIKTMFEKGDYNNFMNIINDIPWEAEMNKYPEDINKQWDFFKTKFLEAESLCVPKKKVYIGGKLSKKFSCNLDRKTLRKLKRKNKMWGKIKKK